jgi:hypothetical protein
MRSLTAQPIKQTIRSAIGQIAYAHRLLDAERTAFIDDQQQFGFKSKCAHSDADPLSVVQYQATA